MVWAHLSSLNGRENPNGGVISCTGCDLMPILTWDLKCVHLVLQRIDPSPAQSIASVLTIPAPYFNGFNPPKLANRQESPEIRRGCFPEEKKLGNVRCFLICRKINISYWLPDLFLFSDFLSAPTLKAKATECFVLIWNRQNLMQCPYSLK